MSGQSVQALAHDETSSNELWHIRLGHLHFKALPDMQNMVCGMPSISLSKNEICKGCMLGKNIKKAFPSSDSRAQGILDLVHSDVCGPMSSPSLIGCLYQCCISTIEATYQRCISARSLRSLSGQSHIGKLFKNKTFMVDICK